MTTSKHRRTYTHTHVQCSPASVGLQARPNKVVQLKSFVETIASAFGPAPPSICSYEALRFPNWLEQWLSMAHLLKGFY